MTPQDARLLAQTLLSAADAADAIGAQQIAADALADAVALDDAARAELVAAIEAAESKTQPEA